MTEKVRPLDVLRFADVPIVRCFADGHRFIVATDDGSERHVLVFQPFQAVRITTEDCYLPSAGLDWHYVAVIEGSQWVLALKGALMRTDTTATFLDHARHYLIMAHDDYVEVVAHDLLVDPQGIAVPDLMTAI